MATSIRAALQQLDVQNDDHWTDDGLPKVEAVKAIAGREVTRQQITDAWTEFNRGSAPSLHVEVKKPPKEPERPIGLEHIHPAAYVEIEDDVVGRPTTEVFADPALVNRAIGEFNRQNLELVRRRQAIIDRIQYIARQTARLEKCKAMMKARGIIPKDDNMQGIKDYLDRQKEARVQKADRAKKFVEAGTTAQDVAAQLSSKAPIDAALAGRKAKPGAARPQYPKASG